MNTWELQTFVELICSLPARKKSSTGKVPPQSFESEENTILTVSAFSAMGKRKGVPVSLLTERKNLHIQYANAEKERANLLGRIVSFDSCFSLEQVIFREYPERTK